MNLIITSFDISSYSNFLFVGTMLVLILFIDTISRERIDPIKIFIFTNIVTAGIIFLIYNNSDLIGILFIIVMFFQAFLWIYFTIKIYSKSPRSMKKDAFIFIIGGIFFILIPVIFQFFPYFGLNMDLTLETQLSVGIGILITAYISRRQPKLAYVLPFRATRLTVLDSHRGISIFDHVWDKTSTIDDVLFGGMMQGITVILNETIGRGNIRQIELEHAILLVYREEKYPVVFVLLSNEFNTSLRLALKQFAEKFYLEFSDKFEDLSNVSQFDPASKLIEEVFPFIPEY